MDSHPNLFNIISLYVYLYKLCEFQSPAISLENIGC
jgi:hypothetical protein